MHEKTHSNAADLRIDANKLPPLMSAEQIRERLAPIGRTLLYELATRGEIQSASLGIGRGKRVFVTATVVAWLERRVATSLRPNVAVSSNDPARR